MGTPFKEALEEAAEAAEKAFGAVFVVEKAGGGEEVKEAEAEEEEEEEEGEEEEEEEEEGEGEGEGEGEEEKEELPFASLFSSWSWGGMPEEESEWKEKGIKGFEKAGKRRDKPRAPGGTTAGINLTGLSSSSSSSSASGRGGGVKTSGKERGE